MFLLYWCVKIKIIKKVCLNWDIQQLVHHSIHPDCDSVLERVSRIYYFYLVVTADEGIAAGFQIAEKLLCVH